MPSNLDIMESILQRLVEAEQRIDRLERDLQALMSVGSSAWRLRLERRNWGIPTAFADQLHFAAVICSREPADRKLAFSVADEQALLRIPTRTEKFGQTSWGQHTFDAWDGGSLGSAPMHLHADQSGYIEFAIDISHDAGREVLFLEVLETYTLGGLQCLLSHCLSLGLTGPAVAAIAISGLKDVELRSHRRAMDLIPRDRHYHPIGPLRLHREITLPQDAAQSERLAGEMMIEICLAFNQPVYGPWQFLPSTS